MLSRHSPNQRKIGETDHATVLQYIKQRPQPFTVSIEGRIKKSNEPTLSKGQKSEYVTNTKTSK